MQKLLIPLLLTALTFSGVYLFTQSEIQSQSFNLRQTQTQDQNQIVYKEYLNWKQKFGKNTNGEEDKIKFQIFSENYDFIKKNNQNANSSVILGLTKFADLSNEEYKALMISQITKVSEKQKEQNYVEFQENSNSQMKSIDWIERGAVTSVKDQDACGGCWAFATVGALEGLHQITTGKLESLSNQQVVSCTSKLVSYGCGGGNSYFGFKYTKNYGIESEKSYPYTSGYDGVTGVCKYDKSKVVFQNTSSGSLKPNSPKDMNAQLQKQPLAVAINGGSIFFQLYMGGILDNEHCSSLTDHQVTLVGYSSGDNTWTVKNSYGTDWGINGFAKVLNVEGSGICGINTEITFPLV